MTDLMISSPSTPEGLRTPARDTVDELDGCLTCMEIVEVTHDVTSFSFELAGPAPLHFQAGQFLIFRVLVGGERVERCYTISSSPTRPERLTITVKRVPGGVVSNWLHDHVRVGDVVGARGPFGQFSIARHPAPQYLFLTAGSGITPAMSMVRSLGDQAGPADVVLVHCARTPDDIIFRDELATLAARPGVAVAVLCEGDSQGERWWGPRGRLSLEGLLGVAPDLLGREVFTCGPPPFMEAVRTFLEQTGADPARCHQESFSFASTSPVVETPPGAGGTTYELAFRRSGRSIACEAGSTILEAAGRAGITLASSCGEGMCGTCKLTLLRGQVDMQHAGGIRPREVAQNKVLACCSTPLENLDVDA